MRPRLIDLDLLQPFVGFRLLLLIHRLGRLLGRCKEVSDAGLGFRHHPFPRRLLFQLRGAESEIEFRVFVEVERFDDEAGKDTGFQDLGFVRHVGDVGGRTDDHRTHVGYLVRAVIDQQLSLRRISRRHHVKEACGHSDNDADDAGNHPPPSAQTIDNVAQIYVIDRFRRDINDRPIDDFVLTRLIGNLPLHRCDSPASEICNSIPRTIHQDDTPHLAPRRPTIGIRLLHSCTLNRSSPLSQQTDSSPEICCSPCLQPGRFPDILFLIFVAL